MNANAKKIWDYKESTRNYKCGYTTISTVALAKGSGLTTDEIKAAKGNF